jgi:hypothetical protein
LPINRPVQVSYSTLSTVLGTGRRYKSYWLREPDGKYYVWVPVDDYLMECHVLEGADVSHYESTYKAMGVEVASVSDAMVLGQLAMGTLIKPKTPDGKLQVSPDIFPGGVSLYVVGAGDSGGTVGSGNAFQSTSESGGDTVVEFGFRDWVYMAGGGLMCSGALLGDYICYDLYAPANPAVAAPSNDGNCNKVDLGGGFNMIVPAAGDGAFNIDFSAAVPVPAENNDGYWDWSEPDSGLGAVSPSMPAHGKYNIFEPQLPLGTFVKKLPLLGTQTVDITIPALKPKKVLPHWKHKITITNSGHTGLKVAWYLMTARVKSS